MPNQDTSASKPERGLLIVVGDDSTGGRTLVFRNVDQFDSFGDFISAVLSDDPEGAIYESLLQCRDERILILPNGDDTALVNTVQSRASVILQKSVREGFGLTVTEAMWKGRPVIGGNVGGIRYQIQDGVNGFLVSSVKQCAERIAQLLKNRRLRERVGHAAKETVRAGFLLPRYLEQYLDLFGSFEPSFRYVGHAARPASPRQKVRRLNRSQEVG